MQYLNNATLSGINFTENEVNPRELMLNVNGMNLSQKRNQEVYTAMQDEVYSFLPC
jgi:hypothetical protein